MSGGASAAFRLTVLNPGGRDSEQQFPDGASAPGEGHQPTNFHAYAACTRGSFHRDTNSAIGENTPVLLLLRSDFKQTERALDQLKNSGRTVAVSLKETGLHQIATQLANVPMLERFQRIVRDADGCIAPTPEAAELYRVIRSDDRVAFIPTPYPVNDARWDFSRPVGERRGIFIGTREFDVPSRNHLAALLLARSLGAPVTVWNTDSRRGAALLKGLRFDPGKLLVLEKYNGYPDYLRQIASHRIVLQLDRSRVPGQVAGDALLCRVPCLGGDGAIDRIAFSESLSLSENAEIATALLTNDNFYLRTIEESQRRAREKLSFEAIAPQLERFFAMVATPAIA